MTANEVISFLRKKDYKYIKSLGEGACGKTVLLHDDLIDEHFVCKKFEPAVEGLKKELYPGFLNEIKLMHQVSHNNVVRIFNYWAFPQLFAGYIIMEYVEGETVDKYIAANIDSYDSVFRQTVEAFCYLEENGILHRDIRFPNILVRNDGVVKVIDLGFGKVIKSSADFNKSISLNWAFQPTAADFDAGRYDFSTEVYFVGKMFEYIASKSINAKSRYINSIEKMVLPDRANRFANFHAVRAALYTTDISGIDQRDFSYEQILAYRSFVRQLLPGISKIGLKAQYTSDAQKVITSLDELFESYMLDNSIPSDKVASCLMSGEFFRVFSGNPSVDVDTLEAFITLLRQGGPEQQRIILKNLHRSLNAVPRFDEDEIPF